MLQSLVIGTYGHGSNLQDMLRIPEAIAAMIALKVQDVWRCFLPELEGFWFVQGNGFGILYDSIVL